MAITISLGGRGERWEMDLSALPAECVQTGSRVLGVFVIVFALFWGDAPVLGQIAELQAGRFDPESLLFLIFR